MNRFLANVKCSLYDIASPSVVCLSVCRLYLPGCNFWQRFYDIWYTLDIG